MGATREKTRERLNAHRASPRPNARRIAGPERKLTHQAACLALYQQHVEVRTFPPVVGGTKKRWGDRFQTLDDPLAEPQRQQAWREEGEDSRNGRLSAQGGRTKQGNPLLRIHDGPRP